MATAQHSKREARARARLAGIIEDTRAASLGGLRGLMRRLWIEFYHGDLIRRCAPLPREQIAEIIDQEERAHV